jgi:hypothetical protein
MAKQGKRGKSPHSGPHGGTREIVTIRNKVRRAKKRSKWLAKRQEKNAARTTKHRRASQPKPPQSPNNKGSDGKHLVLFRGSEGRSLHLLSIEGTDPEGYNQVDENKPSGVHFLTKANKKWFMRFTEFSFIVLAKAENKESFQEKLGNAREVVKA